MPLRARRSHYFFHSKRDDRTKRRKLLFRWKLKLHDKSHSPVPSIRRDLFWCQMVDGKMGKAFCFRHKAEDLLNKSRMPWNPYLLATS
ncbi:hypothetical protein QUB37_04730 [Microcoleus sp. AT3-A2]